MELNCTITISWNREVITFHFEIIKKISLFQNIFELENLLKLTATKETI